MKSKTYYICILKGIEKIETSC